MADNIKYRFIQNVGDYFPSGYFSDDFMDKVHKCAGLSTDDIKKLCTPYVRLQQEYDEYKNFIINQNPRIEDAIGKTHEFNTKLLNILGYDSSHPYQEPFVVNDTSEIIEMIPVRHILRQGNQVKMLVMEMQNMISVDGKEPAGLFEQQYESEQDGKIKQQKYYAGQWREVFNYDASQYKISPAIINKAVTRLFLMPDERRPHFILMMAGNIIFLFDKDKWAKGSYLQFSLDDLFMQARIPAFRDYYSLFHLLCCKQTLAADGEIVLMDSIIEESYKNAYEVTKDLKEGVIFAVETIANEALYWWKKHNSVPVEDYTDDTFESKVKDDCLTIVYRLLFLFYAESRTELEILPLNDAVYKFGYSLESLRDLEMMRLNSQESRDGYFLDESIKHLFGLLSDGHNDNVCMTNNKSFSVRPIDSPLFNDKKLNYLSDVKLRNIKWQEIIKSLSLSKKRNYCGRISYANLGVNQLGSVYESLLAYRGFYAEEDYIEVHKANVTDEGTFLVPYRRMEAFNVTTEVLCNQETGEPIILKEGTFVYRLNGRDRQKSASYYTPEVLTRSTVKYTLKAIIDEVASGKRKATDLLDLKIMEPAMGAAAFQNEVINQLAEAYLTYQQIQQRENGLKNWQIAPDKYRDELQKVKAYIATHNVYGVDLNPTAIELGKLSLWLNVIHKDMETPFFANRLSVGNAVIGAWLKVYSKNEIYGIKERNDTKLHQNKWWEKAPHPVKFFSNKVNRSVNDVYHFLLPDNNMLGVRNIAEQKKENQAEFNHMSKRIKDWTSPIGDSEFKILQRLSGKIDVLLKEYFTNQISIDKYTNNRKEVWDGFDHSADITLFDREFQAESYAKKQQLFDTRYRHDNAYFRLKMVMDYWCSLWFWEYSDVESLPTRLEYWSDIEAMLDVSDDALDTKTARALKVQVDSQGQLGLFTSEEMNDMFKQQEYLERNGTTQRMNEETSEIIEKSKEELLSEVKGSDRGFFDTSERFKTVKRYADQYHFFHPMLEFLEVFWLRGGFDIICGNPPWLKLEFDELGILSEKYPEVAIRKVSAPEARKTRNQMFEQIPATRILYRSEEVDTECSSTFMNAFCNYPLLVGQQTNLYKCVLENGFSMMSENGFMGLLHPETVYDDPKGQPLRKEIYKRLRYHFQYTNELSLFAEVHHCTKYGEQIYGSRREKVDFLSIHNLFHPNTIDSCFAHDGHGLCGGIKDENGKWNVNAHKDRIVHFTEAELRVLSEAFEDGADWESVKLTNIHTNVIIDVLTKLSAFPQHLRDVNNRTTVALDEAGAVNNGIMHRETKSVILDSYEMIFSGPHFYVSNPCYKNPHKRCILNSDYDVVSLTDINGDFIARTNYIPNVVDEQYKKLFDGLNIESRMNGNEIWDKWIDYYKLGFRKMVGSMSERTLSGAILPPKTSHINGVVSIIFDSYRNLIEMTALSASIVLDFYIKIIGAQNLQKNRLYSLPFGINSVYHEPIYIRALLLNCLTTAYSDIWYNMWDGAFMQETWSLNDSRLKKFDVLHEDWSWDIPLRNYFERRQALVEIDVISAMALGLTLEDLEMIYTIQFPVLQQNEEDTWYDQKGNIVFTCSKGLTGVGLDRPEWNEMRGEPITNDKDEITGYNGTSATYVHTIDPAKSELYGGQQVIYYAPYNKCNRIEDYRRAWSHFEKRFS